MIQVTVNGKNRIIRDKFIHYKLGLYAMFAAMAAMGDTGYSERSEYRGLLMKTAIILFQTLTCLQ